MVTAILAILVIVALGIYRFRIIRNLAIFLTSIWFALFITNLSYSYYKNISVNEWRILSTWIGSYFYIGKDYQEKYQDVAYPGKYGFEKTVKFKAFKQDEYVHDVLFRFKEIFNRSMFLSMLDEIVLVIALIIFLKFKDLWNFDELYNQYNQLIPVARSPKVDVRRESMEVTTGEDRAQLKDTQKQNIIESTNAENKENKQNKEKSVATKREVKNVINENIFKF